MKTTRGLLLLAVMALTSAAAFGGPAASEWTGTVAAVSGDDLSLIGIPVHFRVAGPVLVAVSGRAVRASDLAAGSAVTISASEREADGRLRATAVRVRSKNPFDLSGTVSRVSDDRTHVEVEGVSISLDDRTAFSGRNSSGASVRSAADLRAGMTVRVSLTSWSAGELRGVSLAATEPEPEPFDDQEIKGTVDSVSDGLWKIDGKPFVIDANTVFVGAPGLGDFVEVRFHSDGQGNDVADRVAKEDAKEDEFELRGVVEAIGDASWTISGQVILVDSSTQIVGSPAMGDTVEAEGVKALDGTLTARKIQKEDAQGESEVEFTGKVESIGTGTWTVAGRTLTVDAHTQIDGDPKVGDTVEVKANQAADGSLAATRIHAEDNTPDDNGGGSGGNDDPPGDDNGGNPGSTSGGGGHHGHGADDPAGDN